MKTWLFFAILILLVMPQVGCAVHYYDKKTGTEHLWGFGHMKMKVTPPQEGIEAVVHGINFMGFGISKTPEDFSLITGIYHKSRIEILAEDTALRLEWPKNDLFSVRVGKSIPFPNDQETDQPNKKEAAE